MEQQATEGMVGGGRELGFTCPDCEGHSFTTVLHNDEFKYGAGDSAVTLRAQVPVHCCASCDFEFLGREGRLIRHEAVCRHLELLTPTEIRRIRERHGMSRTAFAEITGFGEATLNRWENGSVIQNRANDRFLRLVESHNIMAMLKEILKEPKVGYTDEEPPDLNQPWFHLEDSPTLRREQHAFSLAA